MARLPGHKAQIPARRQQRAVVQEGLLTHRLQRASGRRGERRTGGFPAALRHDANVNSCCPAPTRSGSRPRQIRRWPRRLRREAPSEKAACRRGRLARRGQQPPPAIDCWGADLLPTDPTRRRSSNPIRRQRPRDGLRRLDNGGVRLMVGRFVVDLRVSAPGGTPPLWTPVPHVAIKAWKPPKKESSLGKMATSHVGNGISFRKR